MGCSHTITPASEGHLFACPGSRIGSRVRWIRAKQRCSVYGMPRSVIEAGLADAVVPLDEMASQLVTEWKPSLRKAG